MLMVVGLIGGMVEVRVVWRAALSRSSASQWMCVSFLVGVAGLGGAGSSSGREAGGSGE